MEQQSDIKKLHAANKNLVINLGAEEIKTQSVVKKAAITPKTPAAKATPAVAKSGAIDYKKTSGPLSKKVGLNAIKHLYKDERGRMKKPKAGLRLDTPEMVMKGSEEGKVIIPGKPEESTFYTLAALDPDHDIMPPKGDPLTKAQLGFDQEMDCTRS